MTKFNKDKTQQFKDKVEAKHEAREIKLAQVAEVLKYTTDEIKENLEEKQANAAKNLKDYKE